MTTLKFQYWTEPRNGKPVQTGCFSRNWEAEKAMDDLQGEIDRGHVSNRQAILRARRLEAMRPDCLELQNFIANRLWDEQLKEDATAIWEAAFKKAEALIPKEFKGEISWAETDNRPFLRLGHGYLIGLMHRGEGHTADRLAKKLLRWSKADNLGIRFLLPDIKLLKGERGKALTLYLEAGDEYPESWYQASRLAFQDRDFVKACTYLRRGIAANPYIAEALTGRMILDEHIRWHGSNLRGPEWAQHYLEATTLPWSAQEVDFVDWVFNSSAVLKERAAFTGVAEILTYERDPEQRGSAVEQESELRQSITDASSATMVRQIRNRWNEDIWPWDRAGFRHPGLRNNKSAG